MNRAKSYIIHSQIQSWATAGVSNFLFLFFFPISLDVQAKDSFPYPLFTLNMVQCGPSLLSVLPLPASYM